MTRWIHFPRSVAPPDIARDTADVFTAAAPQITSEKHGLSSNDCLAILKPGLVLAGYRVEYGKKADEKIKMPVLWKEGGATDLTFDVDAWNDRERAVLEVEAGQAVINNKFLKNLFEACMMPDVEQLLIAVRRIYKGNHDFNRVCRFFDTLYESGRLVLPLKGVTILGY